MGGEGVAQDVRGKPFSVNTSKDRIVFDAMPESLTGHFLCAIAGENHINRHTIKQPWATMFEIIFNPVHRLFAQWHQPLFATFTNDAHHPLTQTEVAER